MDEHELAIVMAFLPYNSPVFYVAEKVWVIVHGGAGVFVIFQWVWANIVRGPQRKSV
jgi:hypothetical protein